MDDLKMVRPSECLLLQGLLYRWTEHSTDFKWPLGEENGKGFVENSQFDIC